MRFFIEKITSFFSPKPFRRASDREIQEINLNNEAFILLEQYDKDEIKLDYSAQLKKLERFAQSN